MGDETRNDAQTRRAFSGLLTAAAAFAPAMARAQFDVRTTTSAAPSHALDSVTVKAAQDRSARMTVPVMLNGQGPFPFVVDTGSNRTVISDTLAAQLGLPAGEILQVSSATGVESTPSAHILKLGVGGREVSNMLAPVLIQDNLGAAGMLGIDAVHDQTIIMDFKAGVMRIQPSSRKNDDPADVVVKAKSKYGQLILVDSWVAGNIPLYVIIDTGGEVTIGNLTLRETLLRRRSQTGTQVQVTGVTGGQVTADLSIMPRVSIGHVWVSNLQVAYADLHAFEQFGLHDKPAMLLGMSTLRMFERVSVDFKNRQVRFLFADEARAADRALMADEPRTIRPAG